MEAIAAFGKMLRPDANSHAWAAAAYAQQDRMDEARLRLADFYQGLSTANGTPARDDEEGWLNYWSVAFPSIDPAARDHLCDGLRKAGLSV